MKQFEEVRMDVLELSREEMQNTFGGSWWEIIVEEDGVVFIFHPYDDDYPG